MSPETEKSPQNTLKMARKYALILRVRVDSTSTSSVLKFAEKRILQKRRFFIVTPNPEIVMMAQSDTVLLEILNNADIALPDGIGLVWASRLLAGKYRVSSIKNRVSGVDIMENLVGLAAKRGWRVFLLGGKAGVAAKAREKLKSKFKIQNSRYRIQAETGPWLNEVGVPLNKKEEQEEREVIKKINQFRPHLLFVGFGAPKQEKWASRHFRELDVNGIMVVGGAFDYLSGRLPRAPLFARLIGFEWLFRLVVEPARIRRQVALIHFVFAVAKEAITA